MWIRFCHVTVAALLLAGASVQAAQCTWLVDGPGTWGTPANWAGCGAGNGNPSGTPGPADEAVIPNATPLAVVDLGTDRVVDRLNLQAGRIVGGFDLNVTTQLDWSGGAIEGISAAADELLLGSGAAANLTGGLHTLRSRRWTNLGTVNWSGGDLRLDADAEIDNQAGFTALPTIGINLKIESDNSPLARFHNNSVAGVITMAGSGGLSLMANVTFDNGNAVNANTGTLRIESPGGDFGSYSISAGGTLEFAPPNAVTRTLTGATAISGGGLLRKLGQGTLEITGGYAHSGALRIFDGTLNVSTPGVGTTFNDVGLQAPGVWTGDDDFTVFQLAWNGGQIRSTVIGTAVIVPSIGTATMTLDDSNASAILSSRNLVNQGSYTVNASGAGGDKVWSLVGGADIDNLGGQLEVAASDSNFYFSCIGPGSRIDNRSSATMRFNHSTGGRMELVSCLDGFDNAGILELNGGILHLRPQGVDTGGFLLNGSSRLWLADSGGPERVLEAAASISQSASARFELWGRLRANGASRELPNFDIRPGGVLYGPAAITLSGDPKWMGTIEGAGVAETVTVPAGSTLAGDFILGGDFTLSARRLIVDGTLDVSLLRLRLDAGAALDINGTLSLNSSGLGPARIGCLGTPPCGTLNNAGLITSSASGSAGILEDGITYSGSGTIDSTFGRLVVRMPGGFDGIMDAVGAELEFSGPPRIFGAGSTLVGGSSFIFGDTGAALPVNWVMSCMPAGSNVSIQDSVLQLDCVSPTSFVQLRMERLFSRLQGVSPVVVTSQFVWGAGTILGIDGSQTFELAPGATGLFAAPAGVATDRLLWDRRFTNHGTITWTAHNDTELLDSAEFQNASDGTVVVNLIGNAPGFVPDWRGVGAATMQNNGLYHVQLAAEHMINAPFDNGGTLRVTDGTIYLAGPGSDSGNYVADAATGVIRLQGAAAVRTFTAGGGVSGIGSVVVDSSAQLQVAGGFNIGTLNISNGASAAIGSTGTAIIGQLLLDSGGVLTGDQQVDVTGGLSWTGGSITGSTAIASPLRLQPGSSSLIAGPAAKFLSTRNLRVGGVLSMTEGELLVPTGATALIDIAAGGQLDFNAAMSPVGLRCDMLPCTLDLQSQGSVRQLGAAQPDLQLSNPLLAISGLLQVGAGGLKVNAITQLGGAIEVQSGAQLEAATVTLSGGELRGGGDVLGDLANTVGTVRPGSSPGILSVLGDYTQGASATLVMEVAGNTPGSGHDQLFVSGSATLDGTLTVVDAGYTPVSPEVLTLVSAATSVGGTFANTNVPYASYQIGYTPGSVDLVPAGGGPIVVNTTLDPGDGTCDLAECTLREAIADANLAPDPDVIAFAIPSPQCTGPGGSCVIIPATAMPAITQPVLIDGYSQPGASPNMQPQSLGLGSNAVVLIALDGTLAGGNGLVLNTPSLTLSGVHGLALYRWDNALVAQGPVDTTQIYGGNLIGLRADGSTAGFTGVAGISVNGGSVVIGDGFPENMNIIGGSTSGVRIDNPVAGGTVQLQGNLIGTAADGATARPNVVGVDLRSAGDSPLILIGGGQPDLRNVISGNASDGVVVSCLAGAGNCFDGSQLLGNFIGPNAAGGPLGNGGNGMLLATMNFGLLRVGGTGVGEGNRIAFNGANGIVATFAGGRVSLLKNEIYLNAQLGIDLGADGRTANDAGDPDTGPNGLLNFPAFTSYTAPGGTSAVIEVQLDTPDIGGNYPARVDFYKAIEDEPGVWLGTTTCAQPNVTCAASFAFPGGVTVTPDDVVIGVVTDGFGKSSEASFYATTTSVVAPDAVLGSSYSATVTVTSGAPFSILGDVNVSDGLTESCMVTLSVVGPGQSTGSCPLNAVLPLGARTIGATFSPETPPPEPFSNSSGTDPMVITGIVPSISAISPSSGPDSGGTLVTITGNDFLAGATSIDFGPNPAVGVTCTPTQCTATSPAGAGVVSVRATTVAGTSADTPADDFSYIAGTVPTTTAISGIAPGGVVVGQPYTVSVLVTSGLPPRGLTVTTGQVEVRQLSDGATCTIDLALGSSCSLTPTAALTTAVRAFYLGSGALLPSSSAAQAYPVARADTAIQIVSDTPDPSGVGEPIQVTVSLGVVSPGAGTPTGEVLVTDGIASCGFSLPALSCELGPKALGAATLEARYAGDANFNASVDTESHTITVDGADLSISKFNGLRLVPGGVPSAYVLLVRNLGPQNVANARVTDILPPQLGNASWTCSAGTGASCPASGTGTVDALVSLNAGSSLTFTLTVTAQASPEQVVSNTATVTPPPNAPDPVTGNNSATDVDPTGVFGEGFETEVE